MLADKDLGIIALWRIVAEEQEQLRIGLKYSLENRQNYNGVPALTSERIGAGLQKAVDKIDGEITAHQKKSKNRPGDALRKALANSLSEFPPMLIDVRIFGVQYFTLHIKLAVLRYVLGLSDR